MNAARNQLRQSGFGMIEVLVTLIILLIGLLGLAGLMVQSQRSEMESYQRVQALILLQDMASRINANRYAASCYAFSNPATGSPYLGTGATFVPACAPATVTAAITAKYPNLPPAAVAAMTTSAVATANADLAAWNLLLQGAAEKSGGANTGAMIDARGCVSYSNGTELPKLDSNNLPTGAILNGTGLYTISVAWQGMGSSFANANLLCGTGQYPSTAPGDETQRRVVDLPLRIANMN